MKIETRPVAVEFELVIKLTRAEVQRLHDTLFYEARYESRCTGELSHLEKTLWGLLEASK